MKPESPIWKTKNGRQITLPQLTDAHLRNIIRFLQECYANECLNTSLCAMAYACSEDTPDGASYSAEQESEQLMDEAAQQNRITERYPIFTALCEEAKKRKLDIPTLEQ